MCGAGAEQLYSHLWQGRPGVAGESLLLGCAHPQHACGKGRRSPASLGLRLGSAVAGREGLAGFTWLCEVPLTGRRQRQRRRCR